MEGEKKQTRNIISSGVEQKLLSLLFEKKKPFTRTRNPNADMLGRREMECGVSSWMVNMWKIESLQGIV